MFRRSFRRRRNPFQYDPYKVLINFQDPSTLIALNGTNTQGKVVNVGFYFTFTVLTAERIGRATGNFVDVSASFDISTSWSVIMVRVPKLDPILIDSLGSEILAGNYYANPELLIWADTQQYIANQQVSRISNKDANPKKRKFRELDEMALIFVILSGNTKPSSMNFSGTSWSWLEHK